MGSKSTLGDLTSLVEKKNKLMGGSSTAQKEETSAQSSASREVITVHWSELYSQAQVRKRFDQIDELAASIRENGQDEPIKVHPKDDNGYLIRRGERRWRACKQLDCDVDILIVDPKEEPDEILLQITENLQRSDLTPVELGDAYKRLIDEFGMNQKDIATSLGKSKSHVSKHIALTDLPVRLIPLVEESRITDHETITSLKRLHDSDKNSFDWFCYQAEQGENLTRREVLEAATTKNKAKGEQPRKPTKQKQEADESKGQHPEGFRMRNPGKARISCLVDVDGDQRVGVLRIDLASEEPEKIVVELTDADQDNSLIITETRHITIAGIS